MNKTENHIPKTYSISLIKVRVRLKPGQRTGINTWLCTIHGEKREVTMPDVEWCCQCPETAIHSFRTDEIDFFTITGSFDQIDYE